jgi:hypothetical protein
MRLPSAGDRARRMIAALAMWPERPWFWVGTAALVAALAAMPSKIRSAAAPGSGEEPLFARSLDPWAEQRQAGNRDLPYSRPNIRFCRFQQVRLEAIGPLTDRADLAVFQALAAEWNARCAQYAYQPADKRAVEAAVMDRRESLESEGRALLSAWRRMIRFGAAPAAVPASGSWHFAAGSVADFPSLPSLITSGIPGSPESEPVSWPLLRAPSLALSHQNVAVRVQPARSRLRRQPRGWNLGNELAGGTAAFQGREPSAERRCTGRRNRGAAVLDIGGRSAFRRPCAIRRW